MWTCWQQCMQTRRGSLLTSAKSSAPAEVNALSWKPNRQSVRSAPWHRATQPRIGTLHALLSWRRPQVM